ncbi:MAG UNVERIFIED_CONTAM: hypothetical protein LVR29_03640 [Microcystis novacekii LVE1205-3]
MTHAPISPVVLVILDGWGYRPQRSDNAIAMAKTPIMDSLWEVYPHTLIRTSAKDVGLPEGQMGNSEVRPPKYRSGASCTTRIGTDFRCDRRWFDSTKSGFIKTMRRD